MNIANGGHRDDRDSRRWELRHNCIEALEHHGMINVEKLISNLSKKNERAAKRIIRSFGLDVYHVPDCVYDKFISAMKCAEFEVDAGDQIETVEESILVCEIPAWR